MSVSAAGGIVGAAQPLTSAANGSAPKVHSAFTKSSSCRCWHANSDRRFCLDSMQVSCRGVADEIPDCLGCAVVTREAARVGLAHCNPACPGCSTLAAPSAKQNATRVLGRLSASECLKCGRVPLQPRDYRPKLLQSLVVGLRVNGLPMSYESQHRGAVERFEAHQQIGLLGSAASLTPVRAITVDPP